MRHAFLLLTPLLAACGGSGGDEPAPRESRAPVQTAELTGLYESRGDDAQRSRMCILSRSDGAARFGLVVETPGGSCSGAGEAARNANLLRLTMTGDEECVVDAAVDGTHVAFPPSVSESCAYYCAPGATLAGRSFEKTGGASNDAMQAADLAGDPLCG